MSSCSYGWPPSTRNAGPERAGPPRGGDAVRRRIAPSPVRHRGGRSRVVAQRRHLVRDRPSPWEPGDAPAVPDLARAGLLCAPEPGHLRPVRRVDAPGRQVRAGAEHGGAAARRHPSDAAVQVSARRYPGRATVDRDVHGARLSLQRPGRARRGVRAISGRLALRPGVRRPRPLHRGQVRQTPAFYPSLADRANHPDRAQAADRRRPSADDRGSPSRARFRGRLGGDNERAVRPAREEQL